MRKKLIDLDDFRGLEVPKNIQDCPYCGDPLWISSIDEWSEGEDGNGPIQVEHIMLDCKSESSMCLKKWEEWNHWHSQMPYVYWMPAEEKVIDWLNQNFDFAQSNRDREMMAKWRKNVLGNAQ